MRIVNVLGALLLATNVYAVSPRFWTVNSADQMLPGEFDGMAVSSRGELLAAPAVEKVAGFDEPFVLSQASDGSALFFGTGNSGKVYRLDGGKLRLLYTAPEPEIYAVAWSNGALYVGSSPNGKIYRVDPSTGAATTLFDPKQAYIWAIVPLPDGSLAVGTGVEGRLFRVSAKGEGKLWFRAPETHIRSIAAAGNGRLLAGGSGEGRIYEITGEGKGRALYDSGLTEISAIAYDSRTGLAWAAGATSTLPTAAPAQKSATKQASDQSAASDAKKEGGEPTGSATVEISYGYEQSTAPQPVPQTTSASELYRIDPDGFVDVVRRFEREIVYAVSVAADGSVVLSTGPQGRVYAFRDNDVALIASVPEKQVVSFGSFGGALYATTTNSGAVYRIASSLAQKAEYRSTVKDFDRFSRFGHYTVEGRNLDASKVALSFRSGNTDTPDETWSDWSGEARGVEGQVTAPAARYLQWRLVLNGASASSAVDAVNVSYVNRNVAPVIESVSVAEPGAVYLSTNYPAAPSVIEATSPDENGIFTEVDTALDRSQGKKFFRKGYRTVSWKARDANGDDLTYDVSFRRKGDGNWLRLREKVTDTQLNFDTSQLPDGRYELRVVASDQPDNPDQPLSDTREGTEFVVDNTPPTITSSSTGGDLTVKVSDALSPVTKLEYSVDAKKWITVAPADGISDSPNETYRIPKGDLGDRFVVLRAMDGFYNVATAAVR